MSHAHLRCLDCGSSNIIEDKLYCEELLVCVDCGTVVSDAALVSQRVSVGASDISYSQTTAEAKKPHWDLIKGIQRVKDLCGILRVNHEIQELSQSNYSKAYQHKSFRRGSLRKKEILTGCCLLVSCRLLNWPISTATISCLLDADPMVMVKLYLEMIKILNIEAPIVNIDDEMQAHIHDYQISSLHVPEELSESQKDLTKRAQVSSANSTSSVELAEDAWVVTRCEDLLTASQISELVDENPNASSVEQCEQNAEWTQQSGDGDNHPLVVVKILNPKAPIVNINDEMEAHIHNYQISSLHVPEELSESHEDLTKRTQVSSASSTSSVELAEDAWVVTRCEDLLTEEAAASQISELVDQNPNASSVEQCEQNAEWTQRPGDGDNHQVAQLHRDTLKSQDPAPNWRKRALLDPPCVPKAKKRRVG